MFAKCNDVYVRNVIDLNFIIFGAGISSLYLCYRLI